jgi:uncharacterized membrane protein
MKAFFEMTTIGVEVAAVLVLLTGLVLSTARFLGRAIRPPERLPAYHAFRQQLGRTLLLTLEFLIAADIIATIAVEQTFTSLGMLGLLVLIRTFLSFALELEVSGRWPWQARGEGAAGT